MKSFDNKRVLINLIFLSFSSLAFASQAADTRQVDVSVECLAKNSDTKSLLENDKELQEIVAKHRLDRAAKIGKGDPQFKADYAKTYFIAGMRCELQGQVCQALEYYEQAEKVGLPEARERKKRLERALVPKNLEIDDEKNKSE